MSKSRNSDGNVLFLILIAVALFAALSYAVTSSSRGGGKGISEEKANMGAAAIEQYVAHLRAEVQRLMIANGYGIENLDWRNDYWKRLNGDPSVGILHSPLSPKAGCAVFSDHGGPVSASIDFSPYTAPAYNAESPEWKVKGGHLTTNWINVKNAGTDANDIGIIVYGIDHAVCSILLDPVTRPKNIIESYDNQPDADIADPGKYTGVNSVIDEPENLGDFFANYNSLATGSSCYVGAVIVAR